MVSSGKSCFKAFDGDHSTFWNVDWDGIEKDRYTQGFGSWIEISFNQKTTVSRLDLIRHDLLSNDMKCNNFVDMELSFSTGSNQSISLYPEKNIEWQTVKISPVVDTHFLRITDISRSNNVNNFCEPIFSELRVWGCTDDYVDHTTGNKIKFINLQTCYNYIISYMFWCI
jgi:hypothetical protein